MNVAIRCLGLSIILQLVWWKYMTYSAANNPDPSIGGAYCVAWMLGTVTIVPLTVAINECCWQFLRYLKNW